VTPRPEPAGEGAAWAAWAADARQFEAALVSDPQAGYLLYSAAKEAGYRPEGRFAYWLFGRIGDHLATPRDPQAPRTRH